MPFPQQNPIPFTDPGVSSLLPGYTGVYGIYNQAEWIYVGKGDIRKRLLDHLGGDNPCILQHNPTLFVTAVTSNPDAVEKELIRELRPACNVQFAI